MTTIRFYDAGTPTHCTGCVISGHSGYAEAGSDIVCAAVTTAVQTVANLMTEIYRLPIEVDTDSETASIILRLVTSDFLPDAQKLFDGLRMELQLLSDAYPAYIQLTQTEV